MLIIVYFSKQWTMLHGQKKKKKWMLQFLVSGAFWSTTEVLYPLHRCSQLSRYFWISLLRNSCGPFRKWPSVMKHLTFNVRKKEWSINVYVYIYSTESICSYWCDVKTLAKMDKRESLFQFYATLGKKQLWQFKFTKEKKVYLGLSLRLWNIFRRPFRIYHLGSFEW